MATKFSATENALCRHLVDLALSEDLQDAGDLTSQVVIPTDLRGQAVFRTRAQGVLCGVEAVALVFRKVDPELVFQSLQVDGQQLGKGDPIGRVFGSMRSILVAERTALNFLQHLSGIATKTKVFVDRVHAYHGKIFDTRKTLPGWRLLEKYAVRCGGGNNQRIGLFDGILIKDNHLASCGPSADSIRQAVAAARAHSGHSVPLTVEVDNLDQFDVALDSGPDIILLDNMSPKEMREAVGRRDASHSKVRLEASGGVNLDTVETIAATGVDRISVGAITHSAPALDIGLDYEPYP